jgi:phosphoribosylanthranilate isomerase
LFDDSPGEGDQGHSRRLEVQGRVAAQFRKSDVFIGYRHAQQFGGTGQTFDWNQVYGANAFGSIVIAGGLNPENIEEAVSTLHPFAVDVSSGVESAPGKKSYDKMRRFIEAVRRVDVALLGES